MLIPPFDLQTAADKVRAAENVWNTRDPEKVSLSYTIDCQWRNRSEFISGRSEIVDFLTTKWTQELDYRLIKELWAFTDDRIAVRFCYEYHNGVGQWFRAYGNENWEFNQSGDMRRRIASINDLQISQDGRLFRWPLGPRPTSHVGLNEMGL